MSDAGKKDVPADCGGISDCGQDVRKRQIKGGSRGHKERSRHQDRFLLEINAHVGMHGISHIQKGMYKDTLAHTKREADCFWVALLLI